MKKKKEEKRNRRRKVKVASSGGQCGEMSETPGGTHRAASVLTAVTHCEILDKCLILQDLHLAAVR